MSAPAAIDPADAIREELTRAVGPATIVLAGSRATGDATDDSDYDVVVVLPVVRIARALPRLRRAQLVLEARLGAPVSVNPVAPVVLNHPERNLFVWKMLHDPRVLAAPGGAPPAPPGRPPVNAEISFSYLLSAVLYLLDPLDPPVLGGEWLPRAVAAGARKALLHVAQLRVFRAGRPASRFAEAIDQAGDPVLARIAEEVERPAGWLACRSAVVGELGRRPPRQTTARAVLRNGQYAVLASLSGTARWRASATLRPVDHKLSIAAVRLLCAVRSDGAVEAAGIAAARRALPPPMRAEAPETWRGLRDLVSREWSNAHPVLGL